VAGRDLGRRLVGLRVGLIHLELHGRAA
jgi:hypothetical protein